METSHKEKLSLITILFIAFLLHFILGIYIAKEYPAFYQHDDGDEYFAGVCSFMKNGTFMAGPERYYEAPRKNDIPEIHRGILLQMFTGCFALLLKDPMIAASLVQALVFVLLAFTIYRTCKYFGGKSCGSIGMMILFCHPLINIFSFRFSSELLFILLLCVFILSFLELKGKRKYFFMGLLASLACGVRPTALLLLPAVGVFLLLLTFFPRFFLQEEKKKGKEFLLGFCLYSGIFLLALMPWCIRNYVNYGTWNPVGCLGGFNWFVGNNLDNLAAYQAENGKTFLLFQNKGWDRAIAFAKAMPEGLSPVEQDRRFKEAAFREVRMMNTKDRIFLFIAKAWHFIRPWPLAGSRSMIVFWGITLWESFLFAVGIIGIIFLRKKRKLLLFFLMLLCVGWSAHSLVHLQMRHRIPFLDIPMIIFAAFALSGYWNKFLEKLRKKTLGSLRINSTE